MRYLLGCIFLVLNTAALATNTVYIAQTAQGANDGTSCANAKAVSYFNTVGNWSATPTGIQIGPGTTVFACSTGGAITTDLTFQGNGSSGNPVILDGSNASGLMEARILVATNYFTIQNFTWQTGWVPPLGGTANVPTGVSTIYPQGATFGTIQGNTIDIGNPTDTVSSGGLTDNTRPAKIIQMDGGNANHDITIQNNFFRNAATTSTLQVDMLDSDGAHDITVQGNYFELRVQDDNTATYPCNVTTNCHNDMIQTWGPNGNVPTGYNWTIRYNEFVMNTTSQSNRSYTMIQGLNTGFFDIYSNVFVGLQGANLANGTVCCSPDVAGLVAHIYNNTSVEKAGSVTNLFYLDTSGSISLSNNIAYTTDTRALNQVGGVTRTTNLWYTVSGTIPSCASTSDICGSNPLFANFGANDFSLQVGSPAIGAGTNLGSSYNQAIERGATWPNPTLVTRLASGAWDMGAYQFVPPTGVSSPRLILLSELEP